MPFYYEIKIIFVIWLLSPMTKGSSFLFKKFVHPQLKKREKVRKHNCTATQIVLIEFVDDQSLDWVAYDFFFYFSFD